MNKNIVNSERKQFHRSLNIVGNFYTLFRIPDYLPQKRADRSEVDRFLGMEEVRGSIPRRSIQNQLPIQLISDINAISSLTCLTTIEELVFVFYNKESDKVIKIEMTKSKGLFKNPSKIMFYLGN